MSDLLHVTAVKPLPQFHLWVQFSNGHSGTVDLSSELEGAVFGALREPDFFSRVFLDPELKTVCWPNGADLAPEFLQDLLVAAPVRYQ